MSVHKVRDEITALFVTFAGQSGTLVIPRPYIDFCGGDHLAALLLSQILYWAERAKAESEWFSKSYDEWYDELRMTRYQVNRAINGDKRSKGFLGLKAVGIETKLKPSVHHKGAATIHYRVNFEKLREAVLNFVEDGISTMFKTASSTMLNTGLQQSREPLAENTTETIKEKEQRLHAVSDEPAQADAPKPEVSENGEKPGRKSNPWYDFIRDTWGKHEGVNTRLAQMLQGTSKVKGYKEYNFAPAATLDELREWRDWYFWYDRQPDGTYRKRSAVKALSIVGKHGAIQSSVYEFRLWKAAQVPLPGARKKTAAELPLFSPEYWEAYYEEQRALREAQEEAKRNVA